MGLFEFIIGIVLICTVGGIITNGMQLERRRLKSRQTSGEAEELKGLVGHMHGEITKLKDRVRVLERLVTDGDRNLAEEIERLRRSDMASPGA
ncbi:MAG: hypothetical protein Q8R02_21230 [Hyphomonadaceae bacterium]|nr:hypothetical protein [Hyphomonadaceae bacterium]